MELLILISTLFIGMFHLNGDYWWPKWIPLEALGVLIIDWSIFKRYGWLIGVSFLWPIIWALWIFGDQSVLAHSNGGSVLAIENVVLKATIAFVLVVVPIALSKKEWHLSIEDAFGALCIIDSIVVIVQKFFHAEILGLLGNPSMNGCFIALSLPYLLLKPRTQQYAFLAIEDLKPRDWLNVFIDLALIVITVVAIFLIGRTGPIVAFGFVVISHLLCENEMNKKISFSTRMFLGALLMVSLSICCMTFIPNFFHDSGRISIWKHCLDWWWKNANVWVGTGNGTFFHIGPVVQTIYNINYDPIKEQGNFFIWAHNDWLQTLIEQGILGFTLLASVFVTAVVKCWKNKWSYEFSVVIGFGVIAFFNFPFHQAPMALLGINCITRIFDKTRKVNYGSAEITS